MGENCKVKNILTNWILSWTTVLIWCNISLLFLLCCSTGPYWFQTCIYVVRPAPYTHIKIDKYRSACGNECKPTIREYAHLRNEGQQMRLRHNTIIHWVTEMAPSPGQVQRWPHHTLSTKHSVSQRPGRCLFKNINPKAFSNLLSFILLDLILVLRFALNFFFGTKQTNVWFKTSKNMLCKLLCILPLPWHRCGCSWKSGRAGCRWAACPLSYELSKSRWRCWAQMYLFPCPCTVTSVPRGFAAIAHTQKGNM